MLVGKFDPQNPSAQPTITYQTVPDSADKLLRYVLSDRDRKYATADIYAFLHPLHTASSLTGFYRIDGVPVGKLRVSTTHSQIDSNAEADVTITAGVVHKVDLLLKNVNKEAGAPPPVDAAAAPPLR